MNLNEARERANSIKDRLNQKRLFSQHEMKTIMKTIIELVNIKEEAEGWKNEKTDGIIDSTHQSWRMSADNKCYTVRDLQGYAR